MRKLFKLIRKVRKYKKYIVNILIFILSPIIFLILSELFLSFFYIKETADPYIGIYDSFSFFKIKDNIVSVNTEKYPQLFYQEFNLKKSKNTKRIFIFGGSNIYNLSHFVENKLRYTDILIKKLNLNSNHNYEIINLGGNSWGSYHISKLVKKVIKFSPDLFIIYSGHNEFRWINFSNNYMLLNSPEIIVKIQKLFSKLRIYKLLTRLYKKIIFKYKGFYKKRSISIESYKYIEKYKNNIKFIAKLSKAKKIPLILCTVSANEFFRPNMSVEPPENIREKWNNIFSEYKKELSIFFPFIIGDYRDIYFHPDLILNLKKEFPLKYYSKYTNYIYLSKKQKYDLKNFYKKVFNIKVRDKFLTFFNNVFHYNKKYNEKEIEIFRKCLAKFLKADNIFNKNAMLNFKIGLCYYALKNYEKANYYLVKSSKLDQYPGRVIPELNDIIKKISIKYRTKFIDVDKKIRELSCHNIPGWDYFRDDCHLNKKGRIILINELVTKIKNR